MQFIPRKKYQREYLPRKKSMLYAKHRKILGKPLLSKKKNPLWHLLQRITTKKKEENKLLCCITLKIHLNENK